MGDVATAKYVRKPLYVEAIQVDENNFLDVLRWANGDLGVSGAEKGKEIIPVPEEEPVDPTKHYIRIRVHNPQSPRQTQAHVGDWILYTDRGYKIYMDKAFKSNFDVVEADPAETTA